MGARSEPQLRVIEGDAEAPDGRKRLLERAQAGDSSAWSQLYQDSFAGLLRHVTFMVLDVEVAEDLCQEAFAVAFANIERSFDPSGSFEAWVRGIAHNLVRKHWRKRQRRDRAHAKLEVVADRESEGRVNEQVDRLERERRADALAAALELIPANLREAFVLSDIRELSAAEGADILGISPGNFRVRVSRARTRLRALLTDAGIISRTVVSS